MTQLNLFISWIRARYNKIKLTISIFLLRALRIDTEVFAMGKLGKTGIAGTFIGEYLILGVEKNRYVNNLYHILYCKPSDYVAMTTATVEDIILGEVKFHKSYPDRVGMTPIQSAVNEGVNTSFTHKIGTLTLDNDITK